MSGPTGFSIATLRDMLDGQNETAIKRYYLNDGDGDTISIFHAQSEAEDGDDCLEQRFEYATVSGTKNLIKTGWRTATWDSDYDMA